MKITFTLEDQENGDVGINIECNPPIKEGDNSPAIAVAEELLEHIRMLLNDNDGEGEGEEYQ